MATFLPRALTPRLSGSELITSPITVLNYWQWAHSDVLENVQRGIFAEYLVACALGITEAARIGWASYDLSYPGLRRPEYKIEVKSSAYLQSWEQSKHSTISFGIGEKIVFEPGMPASDPRYSADCFVFCVFEHREAETANVLDPEQWYFYVVPIDRLIDFCGSKKRVVEGRIKRITTAVRFQELKERIDGTRDNVVFAAESINLPAGLNTARKNNRKNYVVWERGTRKRPAIVAARNAEEATLLVRRDPVLGKLGNVLAAGVVSQAEVQQYLSSGAPDMRAPIT